MNRREFVQGAGLLAGFFGFGAVATATSEPQPVDEVMRMALEVIKYHNAKAALGDKVKEYKALSIPFATLPMSTYVRKGKASDYVAEPKLHDLVKMMRNSDMRVDGGRMVEKVSRRIWELIRPKGVDIKQVPNLTNYWMLGDLRVLADRLITPRYMIDIDELDCFKLADMFAGVNAVQHELSQKLETAVRTAREQGSSTRVHLRYEPLETYVRREAYLLEIFHWTTAGGVVY
jgi:hypothetical protein